MRKIVAGESMSKTFMQPMTHQMEIDKSIFISFSFPFRNIEDFKLLYKNVSKQHPKAKHVVYAYKLNNLEKCSDDGEPSKTAGFPILEVIHGEDLDEVIIFTVRYFGGIKLGTGGLMRAYRESAKSVVGKTDKYTIHDLDEYILTFDYALVNIIDRFLLTQSILINQKSFDTLVTYQIATANDFKEDLINLVHNQIKITYTGQKKYYIK